MKFATCTVCDQKFYRFAKLLTHVKNVHRHDPRFSFRCSICQAGCKSYRIFMRHFKKHHQKSVEADYDEDDDTYPDVSNENQDIENSNSTVDLQVEAAKSILSIKEGNMITEVATNRVVEHMQSMIELCMDRVKEKLVELEIPIENFADVLNCKDVFKGLETQSQREQTFSSKFGLLKPQTAHLGSSLEWVKRKGEPMLIEVKAVGYFIPFLESLKRLICHPDFQKALKNPTDVGIENSFQDMNDGSFYKNHPILSDKNAIAIVAYYDDVEVANPLGPKTKNHKLAVFYWYIANIHPAFRSQLSVINLLAVTKTKYVRQFGVGIILKDFLEGLDVLKDGYSFHFNVESRMIKGALLAFPSDTLASNFIGGFKESPSFSFSPCRICNVKKSNLKFVTSEDEINLRDPTVHAEQVKVVLNNNFSLPARSYWSKMYGIIGESVFSKAPHFDVTKCFVLDTMHVLFEGVVIHKIKLLLSHCLEQKYFPSLDHFNCKLKNFAFIGASSADCPTELDISIIRDPKRKIKQNAAQAWQLAVMLPFLISDYVPSCDAHYDNFLDLLKIITICSSFQINSNDVAMLKQLTCVYLSTFVKLYGRQFVTPKMHYLIHLPRQILMFGPPRYLWCFRLEAKHRRLKQSIFVSQNFKNVSLTVAKRLEAFACLESTQVSEFLVKKPKMFNCNPIEKQFLPSYVNISSNPLCDIFEMRSVVFKNINYTQGFFLVHDVPEDEFPSFLSIKHLYSINDVIFLVCEMYETLKYAKKLNSYVVRAAHNFITFEISSLKYEHPVYAVIFQKETHVIVHHYCIIDFDYCTQ